MRIKKKENPSFLNDYVTHLSVVKCLADSTVYVYYQDVRQFLRYVTLASHEDDITSAMLQDVSIADMSIETLRSINLRDIYDYYGFIAKECGNKDKIRSRKASSLRSFFRYLTKQAHVLDNDPTANLELASPKRAMPKYLNLTESLAVLRTLTTQGNHRAHIRDYCILTLFLNCGIRLGELVGLNLSFR